MDTYAIFDLTTLRFQWSPDHRSLAVTSQSGELLAVRDVHPRWSFREAALRTLDEALASGRVMRYQDGEHTPVRIGLYNPCTEQVALEALPHTQSFSDHAPLSCGGAGVVMHLENGELRGLGRTLALSAAESFAALTRAVASHATA